MSHVNMPPTAQHVLPKVTAQFWQQRKHLGANWLHALNLLESLPFLFVSQESQQATEPLLTFAVIQLVQIVVPASQVLLTPCSMTAHVGTCTKVLV